MGSGNAGKCAMNTYLGAYLTDADIVKVLQDRGRRSGRTVSPSMGF
jgi:hypothetical protein